VQVCVDAGDDSHTQAGYRYRWRLLHAIGPVLVAAFANSPLREGRPTGWKSSRQQVWAHMDASRTRPPVVNGDPRADWAGYALDAQVMCVQSEGDDWTAPPGVTLRDWVRGDSLRDGPSRGNDARGDGTRDGNEDGVLAGGVREELIGRLPTAGDLEYHLSTLFPPVRPRGHFEVRVIDAQPADGWVVPLAVTTALLSDDRASDLAMAAVERIWPHGAPGNSPPDSAEGRDPWILAARHGPEDPAIARASRECFDAARAALTRQAAPAEICNAVEAFTDSYVAQDRCPADDLLEETP
ncbi:MAG: glutamate-cysteine ligase family protein, partial [Trebonia sp.]